MNEPTPMPYVRRDLWVILVTLALLLAWDFSGADLRVARWADGADGFPWRNAWLTSHLLHDGGRLLAGAVLAALVIDALWRRPGTSLTVPARWTAIGVVLTNLIVVPTLKRGSRTSCPWDLAEFGGRAQYVSHWAWGVADGGSGHCFPSGHAVAAFAFLALYFAWREVRPAVARAWLVGVLVAGTLFGVGQVLRGAHYPSHVAWSAWVCWTLAAVLDALSRRRQRRLGRRTAAAVGNPA